jgi:ferredoxin-NADP reductase
MASGRLAWRTAILTAQRDETPTAATLVLRAPGWPGHVAGQHVDVRLTAEDGYSTQRSYSLAGPADGELIELTVQQVADGEVSPYLTQVLAPGDAVEIRGPVGGWFTWRPQDTGPVQLIAGGSGIVPLMAMIRARQLAGSTAPFRLLYSVRSPGQEYYAAELSSLADGQAGPDVSYAYTRAVPDGWPVPPRRLDAAAITAAAWPADAAPACFVCGPTAFVETVADILVPLGHDPGRVKTERFGPTGG